ncbi:MAG: pilus assembly protein PilP [Mariprofundaceae bacterium]|nr:pilus assembly protein PilP [Mariprofundaceae bacterium]
MLLKKMILLFLSACLLFFSCQVALASNEKSSNAASIMVDPYASKDPYKEVFNSTDASKRILHAPTFSLAGMRDPFVSYIDLKNAREQELRLINEEQQKADKNAAVKALNSRPKEPLEDKDLTELKLVAIFSIGDRKVAMIEDTSGKGFIVKVGAYMGKNNGHIISINDAALTLLEKRLNSAGEIVDYKEIFALK